MILSVVTVIKDNPEGFERTIKSIKKQTFQQFEYVVVDGDSEDKTLYEKHMDYIDVFVSEKDAGIYDAMNKSIRLAHGDYIHFLNSGDILHDSNVYQNIINKLEKDIVYGNYLDNMWKEHKSPSKINEWLFVRERNLIHQTMFLRRSLLLSRPYDTTYRIVADRKWLMECFREGRTTRWVDIVVVDYEYNGVSCQPELFFPDSRRLMIEMYGDTIIPYLFVKRRLKAILMKLKKMGNKLR